MKDSYQTIQIEDHLHEPNTEKSPIIKHRTY